MFRKKECDIYGKKRYDIFGREKRDVLGRKTPAEQCPLCREETPHKVFVTQPPGYGSLMSCDGTAVRDWRGPKVRTDQDGRIRSQGLPTTP